MSTSFPASSPAVRATRPTGVVGLLSGAAVALLGLALCAAVGLVGWYLSDSGSHGVPRDGIAAGARGWLVAHGSGLVVADVRLTLLPLGVTLLVAWLVWQAGLRLGEMVWDHGPDEDRLGDGERDLTLVQAVGGFTAGYLAVALVTLASVGGGWGGDTSSVVRWVLVMTLALGVPSVAWGSGRADRWVDAVPAVLRDAVAGAGRVLVLWIGVSALVFVLALLLGIGEARDLLQQLGTSPAESLLVVLGCLVLVPQAVLWTGAFLLGPGFGVGAGTVVAPSGVLLGELPLLPILAALPGQGDLPGVWAAHVVVPVLVAAVAVGRRHARVGHVEWTPSLLAGGSSGLVAALAVGLLSSLAGGSAGPGRLAVVGPDAGEVFLAALLPFVAGGLLGAALGTLWVRRRGVPVVDGGHEHVNEHQNEYQDGGAQDAERPGGPEETVESPALSIGAGAVVPAPVGAGAVEDTVAHPRVTAPEPESLPESQPESQPEAPEEVTAEVVLTPTPDAEAAHGDSAGEGTGDDAAPEVVEAEVIEAEVIDAEVIEVAVVEDAVPQTAGELAAEDITPQETPGTERADEETSERS